jgi:hypothetical protein
MHINYLWVQDEALRHAVVHSDITSARKSIAAGPNVIAYDPYHNSTFFPGNDAIVSLLLSCNADVNARGGAVYGDALSVAARRCGDNTSTSNDKCEHTPLLQRAAEGEGIAAAANDADVDARGSGYGTAL